MLVEIGRVALAIVAFSLALACLFNLMVGWEPWQKPAARFVAWRESRRPVAPDTRPLEELATQARRLGRRFHHPPEGQRFEKCEAVRRAYDTVLGEASQALGVTTLLTVIAPGPELDIERERVELALEESGFELGLPL